MRHVKFGSAFLMASFLLTSAASFAQKDLPMNPAVKDALYLIDKEQPAKATEELEKIVAANPTDASLLYYLGYAQIKAGDKAKALVSFEKGIQLNEKEPLNYVGKGYLNMLDKKPADAKAQFDKALAMCKSKSVAVLKGVAEAYDVDNKYSVESVALLNKARSLNEADPDVPMLLGDTYLLQNAGGNIGQAVSSFENTLMVKTDPKSKSRAEAKAEYKIGMAYEKAKNNEVALEDFQKSIKADPEFTSSYRELGQLYYLNKEYPKSVEAYEKYLSMTEKPETHQYQYEYAYFLFANKDYKKANDIFAKLVAFPDAKPTTLRFYSKSLFEMEDYQKSKDIFEQYSSKVKPEEIEAGDYLYYGKTLQKLKQDSAALVYMRKAYDLNKDGDLILAIGNGYYKLRKYAQAIDAYKTLMSVRKTPSAQDYYMIGQAYYYNNQFQAADTTFQTFIKMKPDLVPGYLWEANVKAKMEEEKLAPEGSAKPAFEKLAEVAAVDPVKYKKELANAYQYLGYYYYSKNDVTTARATYQKWLAVDPGNAAAADAIQTLDKAIKAAQSPSRQKPKNK